MLRRLSLKSCVGMSIREIIKVMKYNFYIRHFGFVLFGIFAILAYFTGYKEEIPVYKLFMHCFLAFVYWMVFYLVTRLENEKAITSVIFLYSLILSATLRYLFWDYTNDPYEDTYSCDVYGYERNTFNGLGLSFIGYINKLLTSTHYNVDDLGFPSYLFTFHEFFRDVDFVRSLLLLVNSFFIALSSHFIYKISLYLGMNENISKIAMGFYGLFPFWIVSSAMGLKENVFCFIIVVALYNIFRYKEYCLVYNLIGVIFFITLTYFFRFAITLMLILVFIIALLANENNKKKILVEMGGFAIIMIISLSVIMSSFANVSMEQVTGTAADRMSRSGGTGIVGWLIHCSAAFIGPFPNFLRTNQYIFYTASGLIYKVVYSVFVNFSLYSVIKKLEWNLYGILAYLVMGYVMMLTSGVSLDIRYHITFFPAYTILLGYGIEKSQLKNSTLYCLSLIGIFITFLYNFR